MRATSQKRYEKASHQVAGQASEEVHARHIHDSPEADALPRPFTVR